jgi:hypothetical protein
MEKSGKRCELIRYEEQGHGSFNFGRADGPYFRETLIRDGDWKLIEFYDYGKVELYNMKDDPGERRDLAKSNPAQQQALLDKLHAWQKSVNAQLPVPDITAPAADLPRRRRRNESNREWTGRLLT